MKKFVLPALILFIGVIAAAFTFNHKKEKVESGIKWLTWQQAVELNKTQPKKFFIDVYTDWCGWCKVMDKNTFTDAKTAEYMQKNFHCIKLDAEGKEPIDFNGHKFEFVAQGNRGVHTLAYSLLDGQMSYPTVVYLTEKFERVLISPGYKTPEKIMPELRFTAEEAFRNKSFDDFLKTANSNGQ
jgi:thioredoxin-related protein